MKTKLSKFIALFVILLLLLIPLNVSAATPKKLSIYRGTPIIDGTVDSLYEGVEKIRINLHRKGDESKNASGWAKVVWDSEYLYSVFDVTDPTAGSGWSENKSYWDTDSVELFLDEENNSAGDVPISQFRVDINGKITGMLQHVVCDEAALRAEYGGFVGSVKKKSGGYVVEMAIPWTRIKPKADSTKIGLAFQINDTYSVSSSESDGQITNATPQMWSCETYYDYTLISDKAESPVENNSNTNAKSNNNKEGTTSNVSSLSDEVKQIISDSANMKTLASIDGFKLEGEEGVLDGKEVTLTKIDDIASIKSVLGDSVNKITAYTVESKAALTGKLKATFNTPDGYDTSKLAVLLIADDKATVVPFAVQEDGKTVIASLSSLGTYAVVEKSDAAIANDKNNNGDDNSNSTQADSTSFDMNKIIIIILISVIVLCLLAIICMYIFVFKSKPNLKK